VADEDVAVAVESDEIEALALLRDVDAYGDERVNLPRCGRRHRAP
jgi:hypothetical protein